MRPNPPKTKEELRARDAKRDIGAELLVSVRQMKAGEIGTTHKPAFPVSSRLASAQAFRRCNS
ncbi:MAG: hypothetical protein ACYDEV_17060 [Acidiferrobacter sp.]